MSGVEGDQAGRVSMVSSRYRARKREFTNRFLRISGGKNQISKKLQTERYGIREFVSDTISGAGGANPPRRLVLVKLVHTQHLTEQIHAVNLGVIPILHNILG